MDRDTTIPSSLAPADFDLKRKRKTGVHPIFLIMLGAVVLLFVVATIKRY